MSKCGERKADSLKSRLKFMSKLYGISQVGSGDFDKHETEIARPVRSLGVASLSRANGNDGIVNSQCQDRTESSATRVCESFI
jgi:hypothetical protein